jgi:hypothetical protein
MNKDTFKKELNCKLTEEEVVEYGSQLARLTTEAQELRETKKNIASEYNNRISSKESMARVLAKRVATGEEMREVDCHYLYNWTDGERTAFRNDTGEEMFTDVIPEHEKQQKLDLDDREEDGPAETDAYRYDRLKAKHDTGAPMDDDEVQFIIHYETHNTPEPEVVEEDEFIEPAILYTNGRDHVTVTGLRKAFKIGTNRASKILDSMISKGIVLDNGDVPALEPVETITDQPDKPAVEGGPGEKTVKPDEEEPPF